MSDVAGSSNRRQKRSRDEYRNAGWRPPTGLHRRSRSVVSNGTAAARPPTDRRGNTFTVTSAAVGDEVPKRTTSIPPEVRLTAALRPTRTGGLEVVVKWNWASFRHSVNKASGPEWLEFTVHWARKTCNVDTRLPHCDDPDAYYDNVVWSHGPKVRDVAL